MSKKQITGISIVVVLIAIFIGIEMYAANVAEAKVNEAIAKVANFADIDYKSVSVDLIGMDVRVLNNSLIHKIPALLCRNMPAVKHRKS